MAGMETDHDGLIHEFCTITGTDPDRGKLYLESVAWSLELALASYFEEAEDASEPTIIHPTPSSQPPSSAHEQSTGSSEKPSAPPPQVSNRFATLASLSRDDSSDEEGQAFYAGGSERSGQQVLGPGKKKPDDLIAEMFKAAKEHGAQVLDPAEMSKSRNKPSIFKGVGHRLGSSEVDSGNREVARTPSLASSSSSRADMCLKLWKNGFSVDDGPLRDYNDPANKDFLESIRKGEVPRELVRLARGEVNLNMEDHRSEEYSPPKRKLQAFTGEGYRLGSPAPVVNLGSNKSSAQAAGSEEEAKKMLAVDSSKPTTNIQVRLSDGTRLLIAMNHTHTVGDIRRYIVTARPAYAALEFSLMTTFPKRDLDNDDVTLQEADLLNAVIVQRLK